MGKYLVGGKIVPKPNLPIQVLIISKIRAAKVGKGQHICDKAIFHLDLISSFNIYEYLGPEHPRLEMANAFFLGLDFILVGFSYLRVVYIQDLGISGWQGPTNLR